MMNNIFKILPYFIVEYLAKRYCEKMESSADVFYTAFEDSYIYKPLYKKYWKNEKNKNN